MRTGRPASSAWPRSWSPVSCRRRDSGGSPTYDSNVARFGAGLGLRTRIKYGISGFAEGRVMNSELRSLSGSYGQQGVQSGAHFEGILGLSYAFN